MLDVYKQSFIKQKKIWYNLQKNTKGYGSNYRSQYGVQQWAKPMYNSKIYIDNKWQIKIKKKH